MATDLLTPSKMAMLCSLGSAACGQIFPQVFIIMLDEVGCFKHHHALLVHFILICYNKSIVPRTKSCISNICSSSESDVSSSTLNALTGNGNGSFDLGRVGLHDLSIVEESRDKMERDR